MLTEKNLKVILQIILFITLGIYIIIGELPNIILDLKTFNPSIFWLLKIIGILVSSFMILSSFRYRFILKPLLKERYIAGRYTGTALKKNGDIIERTHREEVEIVQTLVSTTIIGKSYDENDDFYANWTGKLISQSEKSFDFYINLETPQRRISSILTFSIDKNQITGFGITLEPGLKAKWIFNLVRNES